MKGQLEKIYKLSSFNDRNFIITEELITIKGTFVPNIFHTKEQIDKFVAEHGLPMMEYYPHEIVRVLK